MKWIEMQGHLYNADHLQEFYWQGGALHLRILGRSVPEIIPDPDRTIFEWLHGVIVDWTKGGL